MRDDLTGMVYHTIYWAHFIGFSKSTLHLIIKCSVGSNYFLILVWCLSSLKRNYHTTSTLAPPQQIGWFAKQVAIARDKRHHTKNEAYYIANPLFRFAKVMFRKQIL